LGSNLFILRTNYFAGSINLRKAVGGGSGAGPINLKTTHRLSD